MRLSTRASCLHRDDHHQCASSLAATAAAAVALPRSPLLSCAASVFAADPNRSQIPLREPDDHRTLHHQHQRTYNYTRH